MWKDRTVACNPHRIRRGSVYVMVLATGMIVSVLAIGSLVAVRSQARSMDLAGDTAEARLYALSAIELGRLWIAQDPDWRNNRQHGTWISKQPLGSGAFSLEVVDPIDGDLANQPHDPIIMTATGIKGAARQHMQVTLAADPIPLDALKYALHTGGELHVHSSKQLTASSATVSTNGTLYNDGTIDANVEAAAATNVGTVTGTVTLGAPAKSFPDKNLVERYASLGVEIKPNNTLDKIVLTPGFNPWGTTHPDGVYVIRSTSDVKIQNSRIHGTLVVICPGKKLALDNSVFLHAARPDYPILIVHGDLVLHYSSSAPLSESIIGVNFNPPGAPYQGESDTDIVDQYPSEVRGLVHATGRVTIDQSLTLRGLLLCESTASSDAVNWNTAASIIYDPRIYESPPPFYTKTVKMIPQTGSWKQNVE